MVIKEKRFSHKGRQFTLKAQARNNEVVVRAFDEQGEGVGRTFGVTWETAIDYRIMQVDDAVDALMQLAQDDIEHERVPELKKALLDLKHDRKLRYGVTYKLIGNEEHEHPDRFEHMDEAVKVACELLDQRKARVVDIPDPAGKGGGGGMRHSDIVQRGTQLGFKKK